MIKNLFLLSSLFGIGILSAMDSGLNKSTLNQCTNNNSNSAVSNPNRLTISSAVSKDEDDKQDSDNDTDNVNKFDKCACN